MPERAANSDWRALHGLLFVAIAAAVAFVPALHVWPLLWLVPLAAYFGLVAVVKPLRATFRPLRFGRVSTSTIAATIAITIASCLVLVAFDVLADPDTSGLAARLPINALGGVIAAGVLFSLFNAVLEELVFRGILFDAIESQWGGWVSVAATAVIFGYGHMRGYPPGSVGALLAAVYGFALGGLRLFTGGLGLPVAAHVAADATIFAIVARHGVL